MITTEKLPDELAKPLDELLVALKPLVPERLRALVLYGSVAKGKALSATSDLNLLIVLADGSTTTLDALALPLERARQRGRVAPLIVAEGELDAVMRAFPLKFYDIAAHHQTLLGEDPFASRQVPREHLAEAARESLLNLSLRLKRVYAARAGREALLFEALVDAMSTTLVPLRAFLRAKTGTAPDHREDVLTAVASALGVTADPLLDILALKKDGAKPGRSAAELFEALLSAISAAALALEP